MFLRFQKKKIKSYTERILKSVSADFGVWEWNSLGLNPEVDLIIAWCYSSNELAKKINVNFSKMLLIFIVLLKELWNELEICWTI